MLIAGLILFIIGIVGAFVNMGFALTDDGDPSWRGTIWRHIIFCLLYVSGGVLIIIALVLMVV